MKIFVDTNVLLDTILPRKDRTFTENSALFLELRHTKEYELCVSTISLATIAFYLKERQDSIKRIKTLMKGITILDTLASDFSTALQSNQPDIVHSYDIDPHSYDVDPLEEGRAFKEQSLFACKQAAA